MDRVWVQYGSGIALSMGFAWLTYRTLGFVKKLHRPSECQLWALFDKCVTGHEC